MFDSSTKKYPDENNKRILRNSLLFPISKAFLEDHPQYSDMVNSYEYAIESIPNMIENDKDSIVETFIHINDKKSLHLKVNVINSKLYGPNTTEAMTFGSVNNMLTPHLALMKQATYSLWLVGDINYSYLIIDKGKIGNTNSYAEELNAYVQTLSKAQYTKGVIKNGYVVGIPLMMGSKWCTLRNFDIGTLARSGEDMTGYYGCFVIEGYIRYIIPCLKKPINKSIVIHNDHDEQLSRVEIQYSKNTQDYQNSYYIVGAMLKPMAIVTEDSVAGVSVHEFGLSLQLNHPTMKTIPKGESIKALINWIPLKILFAAFGCTNDRDIINYICSDHSDIGMINSVKMSTLYGPKHLDAYQAAGIKLKHNEGYIELEEPLTEFLARYIIAMNVLKDDFINDQRLKAKDDRSFRLQLKLHIDNLLAERFMPAIGDVESGSDVDRNTAICISLGNLFNKLYVVGIDARQQQSKQSLTNKRYFCGQSFVKEFKSFHGFRLNQELVPTIQEIAASCDRNDFSNLMFDQFTQSADQMSAMQTRSLITSFKQESETSKFQNEMCEPKNQIFIWNKMREVRKNAASRQRDVRENWENRRAHPSEMYFLCPTESPDSSNVAKFRALAVYTVVTVMKSAKPVLEYLKKNPKFKKSIDGNLIKEYYTVNVNGAVVGYLHEFADVENTYTELMNMRRNNTIPNDTTVVLKHIIGTLDIWTDGGRLVTPFVIASNCFNIEKKVTVKKEFAEWLKECDSEVGNFNKGITSGFIEYLDSEMISDNMLIAASIREYYDNPLKFTHIALSSAMDGIVIAANPCASLNVGIRSAMATNHLKQAMGIPLSKYPQLTFTQNANVDILTSAQEPIVQPVFYRQAHLDQVAIGHNVTICFMQGKYNQDDSVMFNRESVENGLLKCDTFTTFKADTLKKDESFTVPNKSNVQSLTANLFSYEKLGETSCLPKSISSVFYTGDALIGKIRNTEVGAADVSKINKMPDARDTINPRPMRCVEKCHIHEVDPKNKLLITGQYRVPISGDKINQEQAQKGTIGKIVDPECLPYTASGMRADVYFNPLSVFKRKTFGCLYLATLAKIAALYGCILENSTYGTCRNPDEIVELLKGMGIDECGFEDVYDPETGRKIEGAMFFGMTYYERQHHLVETKLNIRCRGGKDSTYLMPMRGKKVDGGLTIDGKLSLNALNSAGVNFILKDFTLNQCSKIEIGFCQICHCTMCYKINSDEGSQWCCPCCGKHSKILPRLVSASFPLLCHIFLGLGLELKYYDQAFALTE